MSENNAKALSTHLCRTCGGSLKQNDASTYECPYCKNIYTDEAARKETTALKSALNEQEIVIISNLRRNLYDATKDENVDRNRVTLICEKIREHLPADFAANFYYTAVCGQPKELAGAIRKIDVNENREYIDGIVEFLIRIISGKINLPLMNLVERAYKNTDLKKFEKYATEISKEMSKVDKGVYSTTLPRDVFLAYSSKDMAKVEELVEYLESQHISCFVAARNLRHGVDAAKNYQSELEKAMDSCRSFVFVSSMNSRSMECDAIRYELAYIRQKDIERYPDCAGDYEKIPDNNKKIRVEYMIEQTKGFNPADKAVEEFFKGNEYALSPEAVAAQLISEFAKKPVAIIGKAKKKSNFAAILAAVILIGSIAVGGIIALPNILGNAGNGNDKTNENADPEETLGKIDQEIANAISQAQALADGGDISGALALMEEWAVKYPNSVRIKTEVDKYTSLYENAKKQETLAKAKEYADAKNYPSAINTLYDALKEAPSDFEFKEAYNKYCTEYEDYTISKAESAGNNDTALSTVNQALTILPNSKRLNEKKEYYISAIALAEKQALLNSAKTFADNKDYPSAIQTIRQALSTDANDADFKNAYNQYYTAYESDVISKAEAFAATKNYDQAISTVTIAQAIISDSTRLSTALNTYKTQKTQQIVNDAIASAEEQANTKNYLAAYNTINDALKQVVTNSTLSNMLTQYRNSYSDAVIKEAEALAADGKTSEAFTKIKEAVSAIGTTDKLSEKLTAYESDYITEIIAEAVALVDSNKPDEAKTLLQSNYSNVSDKTRLEYAYSKVDECKPAGINDLHVITSHYISSGDSSITDTYGNSYHGQYVTNYYTHLDGYIYYNLNQSYTSFYGSIIAGKRFTDGGTGFNDGGTVLIRIYIDDILIYTSKEVTILTQKFDFSVDVTNAQVLKIVFYVKNRDADLRIVNTTLTKDTSAIINGTSN